MGLFSKVDNERDCKGYLCWKHLLAVQKIGTGLNLWLWSIEVTLHWGWREGRSQT